MGTFGIGFPHMWLEYFSQGKLEYTLYFLSPVSFKICYTSLDPLRASSLWGIEFEGYRAGEWWDILILKATVN